VFTRACWSPRFSVTFRPLLLAIATAYPVYSQLFSVTWGCVVPRLRAIRWFRGLYSGSNLAQDTGYPEVFRRFRQKPGLCLNLHHELFFPNPFIAIIDASPYCSTLPSLCNTSACAWPPSDCILMKCHVYETPAAGWIEAEPCLVLNKFCVWCYSYLFLILAHLHMWRVAAYVLNKQSRTANKDWSSRLRVGRGALNSSPLSTVCYEMLCEAEAGWSDRRLEETA
jgi:hypothetical protein